MNINCTKFLALTAMMSAPFVAACDLSGLSGDSTSSGGGTGDAATGDTTGSDPETSGDTSSTPPADSESGNSESGDDGSSSDGADSTGAAESSGDSGSGGEEDYGNCCDVNKAGGCSVPSIEACVCAEDELCCGEEFGWDSACVNIAVTTCDVACPVPVCCDAVKTSGCEDATLEACVCDLDPFCCGMDKKGVGTWDDTCVATATESCSAGCVATE